MRTTSSSYPLLALLATVGAWPAASRAADICYSVCVQGQWLPEACDGELAGTTGRSLPIQAVRMRLPAESGLSSSNVLNYRAHLSGTGWQEDHSGGNYPADYGIGTCGVTRVEAIEAFAPDLTWIRSLAYWGHVADLGDQEWRFDGVLQGTTGRALALEAIRMKITERDVSGLTFYWPESFFGFTTTPGYDRGGRPATAFNGYVGNLEGAATPFHSIEAAYGHGGTPPNDAIAVTVWTDLNTWFTLTLDRYNNVVSGRYTYGYIFQRDVPGYPLHYLAPTRDWDGR